MTEEKYLERMTVFLCFPWSHQPSQAVSDPGGTPKKNRELFQGYNVQLVAALSCWGPFEELCRRYFWKENRLLDQRREYCLPTDQTLPSNINFLISRFANRPKWPLKLLTVACSFGCYSNSWNENMGWCNAGFVELKEAHFHFFL